MFPLTKSTNICGSTFYATPADVNKSRHLGKQVDQRDRHTIAWHFNTILHSAILLHIRVLFSLMLPPWQLDRVNFDKRHWYRELGVRLYRDVIIKRNGSVKACLSIRLISFRESVAQGRRRSSNKNAFQYDEYRPLQWLSLLPRTPSPCPAMHAPSATYAPLCHACLLLPRVPPSFIMYAPFTMHASFATHTPPPLSPHTASSPFMPPFTVHAPFHNACPLPPRADRILDTRLWKHYLSVNYCCGR